MVGISCSDPNAQRLVLESSNTPLTAQVIEQREGRTVANLEVISASEFRALLWSATDCGGFPEDIAAFRKQRPV
jgi:ribosomal protein L18